MIWMQSSFIPINVYENDKKKVFNYFYSFYLFFLMVKEFFFIVKIDITIMWVRIAWTTDSSLFHNSSVSMTEMVFKGVKGNAMCKWVCISKINHESTYNIRNIYAWLYVKILGSQVVKE